MAELGAENKVSDESDQAGRYIPAEVRRQVRRKCGFGCIFCGSPVFQYDHLRDFAEVKEHDPANINLLCPNHHMEKTAGRLSSEAVAKRAKNPVNLSADRSVTGAPLITSGDTMTFLVGGNIFAGTPTGLPEGFDAVQVAGKGMLNATWEDEWLTLNMTLTDEAGTPLVVVESGELRVNTRVWDFQFVGRQLTIHSGPRKIETSLRLGDTSLAVDRGCFVRRDRGIIVEPDRVYLGRLGPLKAFGVPRVFERGAPMSGNAALACRVGVAC